MQHQRHHQQQVHTHHAEVQEHHAPISLFLQDVIAASLASARLEIRTPRERMILETKARVAELRRKAQDPRWQMQMANRRRTRELKARAQYLINRRERMLAHAARNIDIYEERADSLEKVFGLMIRHICPVCFHPLCRWSWEAHI